MLESLYEKNSVEVLINPAAELGSSEPCDRREVFPLSETV
jgi:hypothetical protein